MALDVQRASDASALADPEVAASDTDSESFEVRFVVLRPDGITIDTLDHSHGSVARAGVGMIQWNDPELLKALGRESGPDAYGVWPAARYIRRVHEVRQTNDGLQSLPGEDKDVSEALKTVVAERLRVLALPVVGWPGPVLASRTFARGEEAAPLEGPIAGLLGLLYVHGISAVSTEIRFREPRREPWGEALVFDVAVTAHSRNGAGATGELVMRASNGEFIALRARGPSIEGEGVRADGLDAGRSDEAQGRNLGEVTVNVSWGLCPGPV